MPLQLSPLESDLNSSDQEAARDLQSVYRFFIVQVDFSKYSQEYFSVRILQEQILLMFCFAVFKA